MYEPSQHQPPVVPQPPAGWGYQATPFDAASTDDAQPAPQPGSAIRRALAWGIDFALMVLLAVGIGYLTYKRMVSPLSGVSSEVASGARELVSSGFDFAGVAATTGPTVWGEISSLIIQGFIALVIIQFLYQFLAMAWTGRTVGKAILDLRVVSAAGTDKPKPGKSRSARRAAVTALTDTGLFSIACCLLVTGWFVLSVVCWLLAVAAFWANALPTLSRRHSSLADLAAGTMVADAGQYRAIATSVTRGGQAAAMRIATEARGLAEHERVRQAWESERAQQLRQAGQNAAARSRQAWESERAQQLRQGAAVRGKQAWDRLRKNTGQTQPPTTGNPITAGNYAQPPPGPAAPQVPPPPVQPPAMYPPPVQPSAAYPPPAPAAPPPVAGTSPYASPDYDPENTLDPTGHEPTRDRRTGAAGETG